MCRSIRTLHNFEPPATDEEVHAAALQYVRKIMGGTPRPSKANRAVPSTVTVEQIAVDTRMLVDSLVTAAPPKNREVEAAKARERGPLAAGRAPHEESPGSISGRRQFRSLPVDRDASCICRAGFPPSADLGRKRRGWKARSKHALVESGHPGFCLFMPEFRTARFHRPLRACADRAGWVGGNPPVGV